jgi:plasmid stabilization system protein ParE
MILSTHPLAADELVDGAVFYARQATVELAEDFIAEFEHSAALLQAHPKLGAVWHGRFRRLPLRRFPYSIVYCVFGDVLRVVALAHHKRRPGYWRGRQ